MSDCVFTDPVHIVCAYKHDMKCSGCKRVFVDPEYGECSPGCYLLAEELVRIVTNGGPFQQEESNKRWRERLRLVGKPRLVGPTDRGCV